VDPAPTPPRRDGLRRAGLGAAVVAIVLAGIGVVAFTSGDDDGEIPVAAATVTTAVSPPSTTVASATTTAAPTTSSSSTTTIPSTSTTSTPPPTTPPTSPPVPVQLTRPVDPPPDPNGSEPLTEVGSISIPKIGLDSAMFEGIRLTTLNHGPGHWPGSAAPGQVGNVVVAGQRTSHNAEFRRIDRLVPGDIVTFSTADGVFDYSVVGTEIVGPDALWIIDPSDTPTATLFACHPPGSTRQRIVVKLALLQPALQPVLAPVVQPAA